MPHGAFHFIPGDDEGKEFSFKKAKSKYTK